MDFALYKLNSIGLSATEAYSELILIACFKVVYMILTAI